jgi:hypothetical protein
MRTKTNLFIMISVVFLFLLGLSSLAASNNKQANPNAVTPGEFVVEPPTLINLGFEWYITGDANRNATVEVWYRKKGDHEWKQGLPLLRIQNEVAVRSYGTYTAPNMFAGSIFDLEPDTEYECLFDMEDPDGVLEGHHPTWDMYLDEHHNRSAARQFVTVRTRSEPQPYAGGNVYHAYPPGTPSAKLLPAGSSFIGLLGTYYTGSSAGDGNKTFPPRVVPGDTILVHAGTYQGDRFNYATDAAGIPFDGTYYLTAKGTPDKPIAIKAAGDGEVIFDGNGCHNLFNVMAADYNYFEGLTIQNTDIAFWAGIKDIVGSSGLTVKKCKIQNVGFGVWNEYAKSKNFYIADNTIIGKDNPNYLFGWDGGPTNLLSWATLWNSIPNQPSTYPAPITSYIGVKLYGSGNVVAYNYISLFHDGMDMDTHGMPEGYPCDHCGPSNMPRDNMPVANDFYNNDVYHMADNCGECDGSMHNDRWMRNRCFNMAEQATSSQPTFAGPTYYIRNVVYNAWTSSIKWDKSQGSIYLHNTFGSRLGGLTSGGSNAGMNFHFYNNLILGQVPTQTLIELGSYTNYSTLDYNGYRPNDNAPVFAQWNSPPFNVPADYSSQVAGGTPLVVRTYPTLAAYQQGTGQDAHSILIDWNIFTNASPPNPANPLLLYDPANVDLTLKPNSVAVDAGLILPNINDDFTGKAPDLGAYEVGLPVPHYGPRP